MIWLYKHNIYVIKISKPRCHVNSWHWLYQRDWYWEVRAQGPWALKSKIPRVIPLFFLVLYWCELGVSKALYNLGHRSVPFQLWLYFLRLYSLKIRLFSAHVVSLTLKGRQSRVHSKEGNKCHTHLWKWWYRWSWKAELMMEFKKSSFSSSKT